MPKNIIKNREKLILVGLFLSKFDRYGLEKLGFSSFSEAYNVFGYALDGKPMSIKNYRDEFDPFFPNNRIGWANREMAEYCKEVMDNFGDLNLDDFTNLLYSFIDPNLKIEQSVSKILDLKDNKTTLKRLVTGIAAEQFFIQNYQNYFTDFDITDTRNLGCGYDFLLECKSDFYVVEVKGLNENSGGFLMTEREFNEAKKLKDRYCLFVVKNFKGKPSEMLFFDPLSVLDLKEVRQEIVQISYQGRVS